MSQTTTLVTPAASAPTLMRGSVAPAALVGVPLAVGAAATGVPVLLAVTIVSAVATARVDVVTRRLPDGGVALTAAVAATAALLHSGIAGLAAAVVGASIAGSALAALHLAVPTWVGFGDVKFAAASAPLPAITAAGRSAASAVAGQQLSAAALATTVCLCIASGLAVSTCVARRRVELPFGPFVVVGSVVAAAAAARGVFVR